MFGQHVTEAAHLALSIEGEPQTSDFVPSESVRDACFSGAQGLSGPEAQSGARSRLGHRHDHSGLIDHGESRHGNAFIGV